MSAAERGGNAFPSSGVTLIGNDGEPYQHGACPGMSMHDYFAAHAPACPDMCSFPFQTVKGAKVLDDGKGNKRVIHSWQESEIQRHTRWAIEYADSMLTARKGGAS